MKIGVPKETKDHEYRIALTPESVVEIIRKGHQVIVESNAGAGIGAMDDTYRQAGAEIVENAEMVFAQTEMIVKVKEPQKPERRRLRSGQILFTYLHLAPDPDQAADLLQSGAVCIAYETVTDDAGSLPLLKPMSQVAGRMAIQAGAGALETPRGGRGVLLGGVPGVAPGKVTIIGGGIVGFNAAQMAVGLGGDVTILDRSSKQLERLAIHFESRIKTRFSNWTNLCECLAEADLVIGAVLIPGATAPKLVTREMLGAMKQGAVLCDVAIDQGGCFATSHPTTHTKPTYIVDGIIHYCVANMPGAVARTSTYALNNVTLPHILNLAEKGWRRALREDNNLANGLNICHGKVTYPAVGEALGHKVSSTREMLQ